MSRTARPIKQLYGVPVALENIALVDQHEAGEGPDDVRVDSRRRRSRSRRRRRQQVGLAVQQGANGDAYHMYPFFSGLCGYIFGTNKAGNLDPSDIGVANPKFLKNAPTDRRVEQGRASSTRRSTTASRKDAVPEGQGRLLDHRPVEVRHAQDVAASRTRSRPFPTIGTGCKSVPFLGVQGFMVTKFAATHGVESAAKDLVAELLRCRRASQARARSCQRPLPGQHGRGGEARRQGSRVKALRQGEQGRRPDAEHPADVVRLVRTSAAPGCSSTKGSGVDPGPRVVHRRRSGTSRTRSAERRA